MLHHALNAVILQHHVGDLHLGLRSWPEAFRQIPRWITVSHGLTAPAPVFARQISPRIRESHLPGASESRCLWPLRHLLQRPHRGDQGVEGVQKTRASMGINGGCNGSSRPREFLNETCRLFQARLLGWLRVFNAGDINASLFAQHVVC